MTSGLRPWKKQHLVPHQQSPFPALAQYHGYSGSKVEPHNLLMWALQGYAVLSVDVRGQSGETSDPAHYPGGHVTGWMTMGILDPADYFYRGVYVDCLRAVEFLGGRAEVDGARIGVMGGSQGGALTLAVAALSGRPALAMSDEPYLCHFRRAVEIAERNPYLEISAYLKKHPHRDVQVWRTLSYFDNLNLCDRISCPVLVSVGLDDRTCPPSTIYAIYNHLTCETKELGVYPYHDHENIDAHWVDKIAWANRCLMGDPLH
jgi:cephalosporin-C deacetylase